jgi:DNA-binding IclR family transcriptional regulator
MSDDAPPRTLDSVTKTLDILEALWQEAGAGVTELTDILDMPKSTVHAHLSTLRENGYLVMADGEYRLSLRFLTFGEHVKTDEPLYQVAQDPVADLAERTGERVFCATEQNGLGVVLCVARGDRSLQSDITVGTHVYLHASAVGKAMLAAMPRERIDAIVEQWGLPSFTEATITTREALLAEIADVRERGVAVSVGEYRRGVHVVAAPIETAEEEVAGAVALAGPEQRLRSEWGAETIEDHLLAAANTIEVNLNYV